MKKGNLEMMQTFTKKKGMFYLNGVLGLFLTILLVSGCIDSGGGGSSPTASLLEGAFVDSPVEGLGYVTETQSGITDRDGTFMYAEGETVTFHVGDVILGEAPAQSLMTPLDLVNGAEDVTHPMVTNMARFLQTLDADMNPENGITITEEMVSAMTGQMIDFNMDPEIFEHNPNVQMAIDAMNTMDPTDAFRMMVSIHDAQNHLSDTMNEMMLGDGMGNTSVMEGVFLDSAVEGLSYETGTQSGITDMEGTFTYMEGETITFHVGDVELGEGLAQPVMTPIDLVKSAEGVTDPMVTNMARFLQTLDEDMNPENGITITEKMVDAMTGHMVNFDMDPIAFEHDPNVQMMMGAINDMDPLGEFRMMVSIGDAQNHLNDTMNAMMFGGGDTGMGTGGGGMMGTGTGGDLMGDGTGGDLMGTDTGGDMMGTGTGGDMMGTGTGGGMGSSGNGMM